MGSDLEPNEMGSAKRARTSQLLVPELRTDPSRTLDTIRTFGGDEVQTDSPGTGIKWVQLPTETEPQNPNGPGPAGWI